MTTTLPDTSHLPFHHKGHPVPWVTRWSDQVDYLQQLKPHVDPNSFRVMLSYVDGNDFRDEYGILWQREGLKRSGTPEFAQVSTYRQRAAMRKRLCQVCGTKIDTRPIRWVIPAQSPLDILEDGTTVTSNPPTCNSCVDIALAICPALGSRPPEVYKVLEFSVWGVQGEIAVFNPETMGLQRANNVALSNEQAAFAGILAKQQLVRFDKFVLES